MFQKTEEGLEYRPDMVVLSLLATAACLLWFHRLPCESTAEEKLQRALDREWVQDRLATNVSRDGSLAASHEPS
jgi:hypothetical protein